MVLYGAPVPDIIMIDHNTPTPVWEQIAGDIAAKIANGRLQPGARLPAERDLCEQYHVAYQTARRAMAELRAWSLIDTVHGKGNYVRPRPGAT